jgi:hypothetical protein
MLCFEINDAYYLYQSKLLILNQICNFVFLKKFVRIAVIMTDDKAKPARSFPGIDISSAMRVSFLEQAAILLASKSK